MELASLNWVWTIFQFLEFYEGNFQIPNLHGPCWYTVYHCAIFGLCEASERYISMLKIVAWIERKPQFEVPKLAPACVTHTSLRSFYAVQRLPSGTETFDVQNIKVTAENGALDAHNGLRSESCWVQVQWKPWPIYRLFMIYHDIPI